jgi:preprotein translocase subunit SecE
VARDRQRAKQRQAERRARRLAQKGEDGSAARRPEDGSAARRPDDERGSSAGIEDTPPPAPDVERSTSPVPGVLPDVAFGAAPTDVGRSDRALRDEPDLDDDEEAFGEEDPELDQEAIEAGALADVDDRDYEPVEEVLESGEAYAPRGRRGAEGAGHAKSRSRVVQFLVAVWAELQRVQWPNRQALTTLTGVVLGFVLIAGGYLGLLDAIFSRIIQAIL